MSKVNVDQNYTVPAAHPLSTATELERTILLHHLQPYLDLLFTGIKFNSINPFIFESVTDKECRAQTIDFSSSSPECH